MYEITPIRLPSGKWVIKREQMAEDCTTILETQWLKCSQCETMQGIFPITFWFGRSVFATQYDNRPSIEFLQQLDKECNE